jgi:hypothetical protein
MLGASPLPPRHPATCVASCPVWMRTPGARVSDAAPERAIGVFEILVRGA